MMTEDIPSEASPPTIDQSGGGGADLDSLLAEFDTANVKPAESTPQVPEPKAEVAQPEKVDLAPWVRQQEEAARQRKEAADLEPR